MEANFTELVFILDRSGSMGGMENDTIGGFNSMLAKQRGELGACRITTVLFDHKCEVLHDRIDIKAVGNITGREYYVRGSTALLDAVGKTIRKINNVRKNTAKEHRAGKVLFVITTDGLENASREFTIEKVKSLVERHKKKHGWEFIFLGANIDAIDVAGSFGIAKNRTQDYINDSEGVALNYAVLSETVSAFRSGPPCAAISDNWGSKISSDYKSRNKQQCDENTKGGA